MNGIVTQAYYPEKKSVGELLVLTNPAIIVPDWQRNYSWRSEHVETFWSDIEKFSKRSGENVTEEYFFGSLVLVRSAEQRLLLLDGQQRLATSTILLSAARDVIKDLDGDTAKWVQDNYLSSRDPIRNQVIHKIRLNVYDRDFFQRLVTEPRNEGYAEPEPQHASHNLIMWAKRYFVKVLGEGVANLEHDAAVKWLGRIVNILTNHFTVIAAFSDNEDSAAEVFETLNDRGIGLSTPDLLRNLIIRKAAEGEREQIVERWEDVIAFQTDADIKAFLRHYWISKHGDVKSQSLYREVKETVEAQNIPSLQLSTDLGEAARLYRRLKSAEIDEEETAKLLEAIQALGAGATILFPALLSIFQVLEEPARQSAVRALLNVYVRDAVIGGVENSVLENRFHKAARNLRLTQDKAAFCAEVSNGALSDDQVRSRFETLSLTNNGQRRYILRGLEIAKRTTDELDVNPPSKVHVEHIYPQTPGEGQKWQNHDRWINRLGNLTLLDKRINAAIKNGVFPAKKGHYSASEIVLTKELCDHEDWNEERIAVRQAGLAGLVPGVWPLITA